MSKVETRHKSEKFCYLCGKGDTVSLNRPNSQHKTKRTVKPNLQKKEGLTFCQNCFRTLKKKEITIKA
jgi:ribosomal protein L28